MRCVNTAATGVIRWAAILVEVAVWQVAQVYIIHLNGGRGVTIGNLDAYLHPFPVNAAHRLQRKRLRGLCHVHITLESALYVVAVAVLTTQRNLNRLVRGRRLVQFHCHLKR